MRSAPAQNDFARPPSTTTRNWVCPLSAENRSPTSRIISIVITVLATIGSSEELSLHTEVGLNHGLTRTDIEEIMVQMTIYGGIPQESELVDLICLIW